MVKNLHIFAMPILKNFTGLIIMEMQMKTRLFIILTTFLCLLIPLGFVVPLSEAQEVKQEEKKIITSGEAKIWIEPDSARVFLGIEALSKTVDVARQENATKIKRVMEALKTLNIRGMLISVHP